MLNHWRVYRKAPDTWIMPRGRKPLYVCSTSAGSRLQAAACCTITDSLFGSVIKSLIDGAMDRAMDRAMGRANRRAIVHATDFAADLIIRFILISHNDA